MHSPINIENGYLGLVALADSDFIHTLFSDNDVKTFFVLRSDHAANLDLFVRYLVASSANGSSLDYIIYNSYGQKIGLITADLLRNQRTGEPMWSLAYAIAPQYRNRGYASSALNGLTNYLLNTFSIQKASLDISEMNTASQRVAQKCNYQIPTQPGERVGYFDPEHMELGMRLKWFRSRSGKRIEYFNLAANAFRMRDYQTAIQYYKNALNEDYQPGTPFTDAQIYSNMGMAYSSIRQYHEAFNCLKRAQAMGLTNASIERELQWLRNNVGLY